MPSQEPNAAIAEASVLVTNEIGLHARPSVKLTKLAKRFGASIQLRADPAAAWIDAKSIVKVMALKAPQHTRLHIRAEGADAVAAVATIAKLIEQGFEDGDD